MQKEKVPQKKRWVDGDEPHATIRKNHQQKKSMLIEICLGFHLCNPSEHLGFRDTWTQKYLSNIWKTRVSL